MCATEKVSLEYDDENLACGASNYNTSSSCMLDVSTAKNNLKNLPHNHQNNSNEIEAHQERFIRRLKRQADWIWLNAVNGVVENDLNAVELFLQRDGNVARALTSNEVLLLNRPSIEIDAGYTLIHLAIRFHRDDLLTRLLSQISKKDPSGIKCVGEQIAPDIAEQIRRRFSESLRIRKESLRIRYVSEHATFSLPTAEIEELPSLIQEQLFDELLDRGL